MRNSITRKDFYSRYWKWINDAIYSAGDIPIPEIYNRIEIDFYNPSMRW